MNDKLIRTVVKMVNSTSQPDEDSKNSTIIIKSVRTKRSQHILLTPQVRHTERAPAIAPAISASNPPASLEPKEIPTIASQPVVNTDDANLHSNTSMWKGASHTSKSTIGFLDRIVHPAIQYKLFLVFLSIWGAGLILFYLSTSFAIILPDPFNLIVIGFFLASTSFTGFYTLLLGIYHLRRTQQNAEDRYY